MAAPAPFEEGRLDAVRHTAFVFCGGLWGKAVDDQAQDVVPVEAVHAHGAFRGPHPRVPLLLQHPKLVFWAAVVPGGEGRHEHHALCTACENVVHHVRHAVFPHHLAGDGGLGDPDAREEHAQVVHDLGACGDCGTRAARGAALFDGHGRGESVDAVDIGFVQAAQELAGVTAQAFHVAALALRVEGVERQAAFSRPAQACHHREFLLGNAHVDVLQVVDFRPVDVNLHCSF